MRRWLTVLSDRIEKIHDRIPSSNNNAPNIFSNRILTRTQCLPSGFETIKHTTKIEIEYKEYQTY